MWQVIPWKAHKTRYVVVPKSQGRSLFRRQAGLSRPRRSTFSPIRWKRQRGCSMGSE